MNWFSLISSALQSRPVEDVEDGTEDESSLRERSEASEHDGRGVDDKWNLRGPAKGS